MRVDHYTAIGADVFGFDPVSMTHEQRQDVKRYVLTNIYKDYCGTLITQFKDRLERYNREFVILNKYSKPTKIIEAKMEELKDCIDDIERKGTE